MLKRRAFLRSLVAIPALLSAACTTSETAPSPPRKAVKPVPAIDRTLSLDPKAFDKVTGVSMRLARQFTVTGDVTRFDVLFGYSAQPEWGCRVTSSEGARARRRRKRRASSTGWSPGVLQHLKKGDRLVFAGVQV